MRQPFVPSAHISGYSFERVCTELEWLRDEDRWAQIGPGYERFDDFAATIDLTAFNMQAASRKRLSRRLTELGASTRTAGRALGVSSETVRRDTKPDVTATNVADPPPPPAADQHVSEPPATNVADPSSTRRPSRRPQRGTRGWTV